MSSNLRFSKIRSLKKSLPMNLVSFLLFSALAFASANVGAVDGSRTDAKDIHESVTWRKLLHYESSLFSKSGTGQILSIPLNTSIEF